MPKQVVVIMQNQYPFGECQQMTSQMTRVVVRKKLAIFPDTRNGTLAKINILRRLHHECMIKLNSLLQQQQSLHLLFEYVPIKVETWISNINEQFIQSFREQLVRFSSFLANNDIILQFRLANVGMDQNYNAKYFLNLDFEVDPNINKEKLKSAYIRDIYNIFKPYIQKDRDIRKSEAFNSLNSPSNAFDMHKDLPQFKKQNNYEMESIIVSSNEGSRKNQLFGSKREQIQQNKTKTPNYAANYISNPSVVKVVADPEPTELDDSYLKQFMDVLDNAQGQERQNDLLMSQPGKKSTIIEDQHMFKTRKKQQNANNRSFQGQNSGIRTEELQNYQPIIIRKIHRFDSKKAQRIHSQVAAAITNTLKVIDRFNNSRY